MMALGPWDQFTLGELTLLQQGLWLIGERECVDPALVPDWRGLVARLRIVIQQRVADAGSGVDRRPPRVLAIPPNGTSAFVAGFLAGVAEDPRRIGNYYGFGQSELESLAEVAELLRELSRTTATLATIE